MYEQALSSNEFLDYIVELDPKLKIKTPPPFYLDLNISGLGKSGALAGALSISEPGDMIRPVLLTSGAVIVQLASKDNFEEPAFELVYEELQRQLLTTQQNTIFSDWVEDMREKAEIIDLRNNKIDIEHTHL